MGMDDGRGLQIYREVISDLGPIEQLREVLPDIDRYVVDFFYGEIYARPALELKTREAVSVASLGTAAPQSVGGVLAPSEASRLCGILSEGSLAVDRVGLSG
jgi:hypothetical protein